jgi:hypothetical protein
MSPGIRSGKSTTRAARWKPFEVGRIDGAAAIGAHFAREAQEHEFLRALLSFDVRFMQKLAPAFAREMCANGAGANRGQRKTIARSGDQPLRVDCVCS